MGRLIVPIVVTNTLRPEFSVSCNALVDTGASDLILPEAFREQLGEFEDEELRQLTLGDQRKVLSRARGPVRVDIADVGRGWCWTHFLPLVPENGEYLPILGHMALQSAHVMVDMLNHRLFKAPYVRL